MFTPGELEMVGGGWWDGRRREDRQGGVLGPGGVELEEASSAVSEPPLPGQATLHGLTSNLMQEFHKTWVHTA